MDDNTEVLKDLTAALNHHSDVMEKFIACTDAAVKSDNEQLAVLKQLASATSVITDQIGVLGRLTAGLTRLTSHY